MVKITVSKAAQSTVVVEAWRKIEMYMYLNTDKRDRKMNNIKTVQRKGRVLQNRLKYSDVKIYYKASNVVQMEQNDGIGTDQAVQKYGNIERGIIVYVKTLNQLGKVENVNEKTYSIRFFSNILDEIDKEHVLPMYSNTGSSNKVFSSVMEHGILSPKEREQKKKMMRLYFVVQPQMTQIVLIMQKMKVYV